MTIIQKFVSTPSAPVLVSRINDVSFKDSTFATLLESCKLRGLISSSTTQPNRTTNGYVWGQVIGEGIQIITSAHPYITKNSMSVDLVGTQDQIRETISILELIGAVEAASKIKYLSESDVQYHTTLNPSLWDNNFERPVLLAEVHAALSEAAKEFITYMKLPLVVDILDVTLTGSSANYNWTKSSDIDLHILVDLVDVNSEYKELVVEYMKAKKSTWNDAHDINIRGIPVEFYAQDINEKHHSTGVYSVSNDEWIDFPTHNPPTIDDNAVDHKVKELTTMIEQALKSNKADFVEKVFDKVTKMRKTALEKGGEYAVGNIAFKELRKRGLLDKLANCKINTFDRTLSVEDEEITRWKK